MNPDVKAFFDPDTSTITYVVSDPESGKAAMIDPVLDYDPKSGRTTTRSADKVVRYVTAQGLTTDWILETHIHADHLSAAPYLKEKLGGQTGIGAEVPQVQNVFKDLFNAEEDFRNDGSQFDALFGDNEQITLGGLTGTVLHTPGHTPACATYVFGDAAFIGDTLFMPDVGTARCDFPGGDAATLYASVRRILSLPQDTRLFTCHDYAPDGREVAWETSVDEQRKNNIHINGDIDRDSFINVRESRDATLSMPVLILPSVQVNMRGGEMPPAEENGMRYLKIPVNGI